LANDHQDSQRGSQLASYLRELEGDSLLIIPAVNIIGLIFSKLDHPRGAGNINSHAFLRHARNMHCSSSCSVTPDDHNMRLHGVSMCQLKLVSRAERYTLNTKYRP